MTTRYYLARCLWSEYVVKSSQVSLVIGVWVLELDSAGSLFLNDLQSLDSTCGTVAGSEGATECCELLLFTFPEIGNSQKEQSTALYL